MSDAAIAERVRIWSNGTEHGAWESYNCDRCAKMHLDPKGQDKWECDLVEAQLDAQFGDGTLDAETARRLGYSPATARLWVWSCAEFEPRPAVLEHVEHVDSRG